MVPDRDSAWRDFLAQAYILMEKYERNEISLMKLDQALAAFSGVVDEFVLDSCLSICTEIGGAPRYFSELKALLRREPSRAALDHFLKT